MTMTMTMPTNNEPSECHYTEDGTLFGIDCVFEIQNRITKSNQIEMTNDWTSNNKSKRIKSRIAANNEEENNGKLITANEQHQIRHFIRIWGCIGAPPDDGNARYSLNGNGFRSVTDIKSDHFPKHIFNVTIKRQSSQQQRWQANETDHAQLTVQSIQLCQLWLWFRTTKNQSSL